LFLSDDAAVADVSNQGFFACAANPDKGAGERAAFSTSK
jgi:hypothetical protein